MNYKIVLDEQELSLVEGFCLDKADRTRKEYKREINSFREFINKPLAAATPVDGQSYLDSLRKAGKASSTIRRIYDQLKAVYNYLFMEGYIRVNPFHKIEKPPASKQVSAERVPGPDDFKKIVHTLQECFDSRELAIIFLIATTGLRIGKALQVRWNDFVHAKDHIGLRISTTPPRYIKIFDTTWQLIDEYRRSMGIPDQYLKKNYIVFINNKNLARYLEEPEKCRPITQDWIRKVMERVCKAADIPLYTAKDLRHAFALYALNFGIHNGNKDKNTIVKEVTDQMGWSSEDIVTRYNGVIEQLLYKAGTYPESFFQNILE